MIPTIMISQKALLKRRNWIVKTAKNLSTLVDGLWAKPNTCIKNEVEDGSKTL